MKKLQNNFTTPEQSKRLLELGVPADSADCFYQLNYPLGNLLVDTPTIISFNLDVNEIVWDEVYAIPCWSVGRLIEIFAICFDPDFIEFDTFADGTCFVKQMIEKIEIAIEAMDFSKLEE